MAAGLVPPEEPLILVLNGLDHWECEWIRSKLRHRRCLALRHTLSHGAVLDAFLKGMTSSFGIMDSDLFVFEPGCFRKAMEISANETASVFFSERKLAFKFPVPLTFFLFLNQPLLKALRRKYKVGAMACKFDELPALARQRLMEIGFDTAHYPQVHKQYFDTLQALLFLGLADGKQFRLQAEHSTTFTISREMVHIGAVSYGHTFGEPDKYHWRGAYFAARALEACQDEALQRRYESKHPWMSTESVLRKVPGGREGIGHEFCEFVEETVRTNFGAQGSRLIAS